MKNETLKLALDALEDVGVLTDREWQAVHKNKANELRQAIAELESQEPVAWADHGVVNWIADKQFKHASLLYTHPPQRTWVGLTDVELAEYADMEIGSYDRCLEVEAKLKEKNT
jgi:hypothetical protein